MHTSHSLAAKIAYISGMRRGKQRLVRRFWQFGFEATHVLRGTAMLWDCHTHTLYYASAQMAAFDAYAAYMTKILLAQD